MDILDLDNFYSVSGSEVDLRSEMDNFLSGTGIETPKAQYGLIRKMRVDENGNLIQCPCADKVTNEADKDYFCPVCFGEKFFWDEKIVKFYRVSLSGDGHGSGSTFNKTQGFGIVNISQHIFYFRFDTDISTQDKIIDIKLNNDGQIIYPVKRQFVWRVNQVIKFRGTNGRIEYIKIFANDEDQKYLTQPKS